MVILIWGVVGIAVGAVCSEILRAKKPDLIKNVQDAAKRLAESLCASKSKKGEKDA